MARFKENGRKSRRVWLGLDLSQTEDNTAVAMVTEEEEFIYARIMGFIPEGKMEIKRTKEKVDYPRAVRSGECTACGDEVIDYGEVERYILGLEEEYGVEIQKVGYDRYNAISTVQKLEAEGITCVEIRQHSSVLHMPTKLLKECILKGQFQYDENRLLEINFQNARCTEDTNLNKYVNKKRSSLKRATGTVTLPAILGRLPAPFPSSSGSRYRIDCKIYLFCWNS